MTGRGGHVYRPTPTEGYEWVLPEEEADFETLLALEGHPQPAWRPRAMKLLKVDDEDRPLRPAGMPWLGSHVLVLRDRAIDSIGPLLEPHGQLLPLVCPEARLVVFDAHVLSAVLDEERSDAVRFGSGRIMRLKTPVFRKDAIAEVGAFKVAEMPRGSVYLTPELVRAIVETGDSSGTSFIPADRAGG